MISDVTLNVLMLSIIMLKVIILNVIMLSVIIISVILPLCHYAEHYNDERLYAECYFTECHVC
jgi:hypothetical protein